MPRTVMGLLTLLLFSPAAWALDDKKDKGKDENPATPRQELQKLKSDFMAAQQDAFKALREAKTDDERAKASAANTKLAATHADIFLKWAEKNAKDPIAVEALSWVTQNAPFSTEASKAETQLRSLVDKGTNKDVQGKAAYALAEALEQLGQIGPQIKMLDANQLKMAEKSLGKETMDRLKALDADKLSNDATALLERIEKDFADVKYGPQTLGAVVKPKLFELRHLSVGKEAPDIEGEDLEGKKFKLSDYRGKVLVLDFWGNW